MTSTSTNPNWSNTDITGETENWTSDVENASRRMGCSALAPAIVASQINNILGNTAHIAFAMATSQATGSYKYPDAANAISPLYSFMTPDMHREATSYVAYVAHMPPINSLNWADWSNTYISTNAFGGGNSVFREYETNATNGAHYNDLIVDRISLPRGNVSNSNYHAAISVYGGARPVDVVVYAAPALTLYSDLNHGYVNPAKAKPSSPVLSDIAEDCRARLHEIRTSVIPPAATWAAQGTATGFSQAGTSPGDQLGMVVESSADGPNTRVNLMDHAVTSRNADTPGVYVHGYRQGIGPEDTAGGTTVYYELHALASTTNAHVNGILYAESGWSNTTVSVTENIPAWVAITDIIINSAQDESGATEKAARTNKIDIYGSCNSGGLYVHGFTVKAKVPQTAV
jgi:hypothetical protein